MNSNKKIIITAILATLVGIGIGYFLFGNQNMDSHSEHNHTTEAVPMSNESAVAEEWICSMHPQIRQNEPGLCPICEMDLIPAGSNESDDPLVLQMTEEAMKLANVQTTVIGEESTTASKILQLSGKVAADERRVSSQVAHVPGRIEQLFVTFTGESVYKGQKLATIYSPDLITAQKELIEAKKLVDLNPNLVEAARNKLRYWKIGESTIQAIEEKGEIQETFTLFADQSGIVKTRKVSVGDYVKIGEPLFDLMNLSKVWILFDAYEDDLATIKVGDKIEFTTPTYPNQVFQTRITFIDPIINSETRVAAIRTEVSNKKGLLKPEMLVYGKLQSNRKASNNLSVPKSAVLWTGKRSVVYVKVSDMEIPSFKYKEIEIGESLGNSYQVLEGLEIGEEVVTNGSFTIDAAAQLNNQTSMMNKNVQLKKEAVGIPNFQAETPDEFKKQLNTLANKYIQLKDAFVATDANAAGAIVPSFLEKLNEIDMSLVKGEAHEYWMQQLNALQSHGENIGKTKDVEDQRKQFGFLSEALINSIEAFGTLGKALYVQHCPMAFNNEGGDWLALEEQIQNPYFGDKMMKCGVVKKELTERTEAMNSTPNKPMQGHNH